ncbi:hypothetical protein AB8E32_13935 [Marinomonas polaris]|uniref:hypothetical protein n=1 Tax=Marinomonas polaris TaxID=293552 RepID=UPI003511532A
MEWIKQNKGFLALIIFSIIWCSGALWLLSPRIYLASFDIKMGLNELGDYLAGVFSPLAFLWLVYGYFMQNKELKNQIIEIKNTSNLNKKILEHQININNKNQEDRLRIKKPIFTKLTTHILPKSDLLSISFKNIGSEIYDFSLLRKEYSNKNYIETWKYGETNKLETDLSISDCFKLGEKTCKEESLKESILRSDKFYFEYRDKEGIWWNSYLQILVFYGLNEPIHFSIDFPDHDGEISITRGRATVSL